MQEWQYQLVISAITLVALLGLRWAIVQVLVRYIRDLRKRYVWQKLISYFIYTIILVVLVSIWIDSFQSAATFLGLLTAGLAIALKDPIANFFGWIYLIVKRPFEMGDRISIEENQGDVLDVSFFDFTLLEIGVWVDANQSTGRIIHIPNGTIFTKPVINFTQGFEFIWDEISVTITFESNWEKAKQILLNLENEKLTDFIGKARLAIKKGQRKYNIKYNKITPTVYTSIREHGVRLTLRYLCNPRNQRGFQQLIWEEILRRFGREDDIQFAYPTQRIRLDQDTKE